MRDVTDMENLKMHHLTIPGRLPGLNDYTDASRSGKMQSARMKRDAQATVMWHIKSQLRGVTIEHPVHLSFTWFEPDRRRDRDNISSFGRKIIQDALVSCGVLYDDGWDYVISYADDFAVDAKKPRIELVIVEQPGRVKPKSRLPQQKGRR